VLPAWVVIPVTIFSSIAFAAISFKRKTRAA
jgi:hypothetical protein